MEFFLLIIYLVGGLVTLISSIDGLLNIQRLGKHQSMNFYYQARYQALFDTQAYSMALLFCYRKKSY